MSSAPEIYQCKICQRQLQDKAAIVEHLRLDHEILEVASYAATTMINEQYRDRIAWDYYKQLERIKKEIASG